MWGISNFDINTNIAISKVLTRKISLIPLVWRIKEQNRLDSLNW